MKKDCLCGVSDKCGIEYTINCPCRTCVVKSMCSQVCYERHLYGAKDFGVVPYSKEKFKEIPNKNWMYMKKNLFWWEDQNGR